MSIEADGTSYYSDDGNGHPAWSKADYRPKYWCLSCWIYLPSAIGSQRYILIGSNPLISATSSGFALWVDGNVSGDAISCSCSTGHPSGTTEARVNIIVGSVTGWIHVAFRRLGNGNYNDGWFNGAYNARAANVNDADNMDHYGAGIGDLWQRYNNTFIAPAGNRLAHLATWEDYILDASEIEALARGTRPDAMPRPASFYHPLDALTPEWLDNLVKDGSTDHVIGPEPTAMRDEPIEDELMYAMAVNDAGDSTVGFFPMGPSRATPT
jgi:hypothetical protein